MMAIVWALSAVALGCALVYAFGAVPNIEPRWARALLVFGGGAAIGIGVTSCLFFLCRLAAPATPKLAMFFEAALVIGLIYMIWRGRESDAPRGATDASPYQLLLMAALIVAMAIVTSAMSDAWQANPEGGWDAWSIWNLRARYLDGELPQRAWSAALFGTHPEYPLLVSSFVARCWAYSDEISDAAAIAVSYLFFLAMAATITGGLAILRGRALGLLAGLAVVASPMLLHEVIAQYADIPLACYFVCATMFLLLDRPALAGLFASLAAWTKDEGVLYLVVFFAALALLRRRQIMRAAIGALPATLLVIVFKLALAPKASGFFGQGSSAMMSRLFDPARMSQVLGAFVREYGALGVGWYHPILPLLALAVALRFDRARRGDLFFAAALPVAMLAGYFAIFLITPFDLKWQLDTALYRLFAQVWPSVLLAFFVGLRTPESAIVLTPEPAAKTHKKAKVRHA